MDECLKPLYRIFIIYALLFFTTTFIIQPIPYAQIRSSIGKTEYRTHLMFRTPTDSPKAATTRLKWLNATLTAIVISSVSESVFFTLSHTKTTLLYKVNNYHYSIVYSFVDFLHHNYWHWACFCSDLPPLILSFIFLC